MIEFWKNAKYGFQVTIGVVAALGSVQLLLWLLNQIFGHAPKLPW